MTPFWCVACWGPTQEVNQTQWAPVILNVFTTQKETGFIDIPFLPKHFHVPSVILPDILSLKFPSSKRSQRHSQNPTGVTGLPLQINAHSETVAGSIILWLGEQGYRREEEGDGLFRTAKCKPLWVTSVTPAVKGSRQKKSEFWETSATQKVLRQPGLHSKTV